MAIFHWIKNGEPTGKILYYSDFRHESGSEVFERILIENGYERYNSEENPIEELIGKKSTRKRYTFITGKETQEQRRINKEAFNHDENLRGEYIQLILISSSGAVGISLKCVRQVHVMEPFWNYIRVDQVLGRAIRMKSHITLPENERNVEQYLYVSMLPEGETVDEVYQSMKQLQWSEVENLELTGDIKSKLTGEHKAIYKTITKILSMKKETNGRTVDQILFDIMEKKYNISAKIIDVIKESSVDCIQHTRDDIQLNEKCLRFSSKLSEEESHFPGITSSELNQIDQKQFQSNFLFFIEPDIYVIKARKNEKDIYVYYQVEEVGESVDVRYIRENGIRVSDYEPEKQLLYVYEKKNHSLNKKLGSMLSIFQSIYTIPEYILTKKIRNSIFPPMDDIVKEEHLEGYIIKYNVNERLFYSPVQSSSIIKLYEYGEYKDNNESIEFIKPIIVRGQKIYLSKN